MFLICLLILHLNRFFIELKVTEYNYKICSFVLNHRDIFHQSRQILTFCKSYYIRLNNLMNWSLADNNNKLITINETKTIIIIFSSICLRSHCFWFLRLYLRNRLCYFFSWEIHQDDEQVKESISILILIN